MLGQVGKGGRKLIFAGKGMSVKTGRYLGESMLVGAVTGLAVVAFKHMIDFAAWLYSLAACRRGWTAWDPWRWLLLVLPALGALAGHLLIKRFSKLEHARGTDSAVRAYHQRGGYITGTVIPVKPVASVLTVGSGGSAGYEGPVTLLGAACGSFIARKMGFSPRARRVLMAAGLAAGIAALFQAPLAGAIFGFEIFYSSSDIEDETVLPCFIASAASYSVYAFLLGGSAWDSIFFLDAKYSFSSILMLAPYTALALATTFGARVYISLFRGADRMFGALCVPEWMKVCAGGLAAGAIGFFFPDILGTSYSVVRAVFSMDDGGSLAGMGALSAAGLFAVFFLKAVATAFTVGGGGSGGLFAPALVCGCALGASCGMALSAALPAKFCVEPAAFGLVGMAGFMASSIRIPLTAIVMVAEMSGNHELLLPAMWVCGISFWLNNDWSLYRSQVHNQEASPVHRVKPGRAA